MPYSRNINPRVRQKLGAKIIIPIVGPSSVGKTSIMRAVMNANPDFHRTVSFTTRPPRPGEDPDTYRFLPNTEQLRADIVKKFENGDLVQFAIHPTTGFLYGTSLDDYSGKYNLLDTLSGEVANLKSLGFAACQCIMIVATPDEWQSRFDSNQFSPDEADKRIKEGIASLRWGIEQQGAVRWIENRQNHIDEAVKHVVAIAHNELHENDERARNVGHELLSHLERKA